MRTQRRDACSGFCSRGIGGGVHNARVSEPTSPADHELFASWCGGDDQAGNDLVQRHFSSVYGFFVNKVGAGALVDDLIQRTFLACVESRDRFRGDASFRTYLFAVARNELLQEVRKRGRITGAMDAAEHSVESLGLAGEITTPSGAAMRTQEQQLLLRALRRLPLDYQIAFELFYWEDLSGGELAEVLGEPEGTIRSRLRRGRQMLEREIEQISQDPELRKSTIDGLETWARGVAQSLGRPPSDASGSTG